MRRAAAALAGMSGGLFVAVDAWACPGYASHEPSAWYTAVPVLMLLGVTSTVWALLVPSPLRLKDRRKLWSLVAAGTVLGMVQLVTGAWRERRMWRAKVEESIRQKIGLEGLLPSWRALALRMPDTFRSVMALATTAAVAATMFMWGWTVATPYVTWGEGWALPVTFTADTVLTFVVVRWMIRRVGFHLAAGLVDVQGVVARICSVVFRGSLMGAAGGWLFGSLFGLSSGIQTVSLLDVPAFRILQIMLYYGMCSLVLGAALGAVTGLSVLATWRRPRALLTG